MKKVIVAGSRTFNDYNLVKNYLDLKFSEPIIIVSGCAKGADKLGERYADEKGFTVEKHPAEWSNLEKKPCVIKYNSYGAYNSLAGMNRNAEMLDSVLQNEDGGLLIAFWDGVSKGTKNMIDISRKVGIEVIIVYT